MSKNTDVMLNEDIDFPEVRCIGDDGEQYGLISSSEALKIAEEKGVDLVLIVPDAKPPVCKVMDYGKFRYQQEKKLKEAKKKQKQIEIKEIKLSVKIAINDINYKVKHAKEFLSENKHVRFRVFLRGREVSEPQVGFEVLNKVASMLEEVANVDKDYKIEVRYLNMLVTTKK